MDSKLIVYIAGPFSRLNGRSEKENTRFAERVARMAQSRGLAPIVPHSSILNGVYGQDSDPTERKEGTISTLSILEMVAKHPESELWVIADSDEEGNLVLSTGTQLEVDLWTDLRGDRHILTLHRDIWAEFVEYDKKERQEQQTKQVYGEFEITTGEVDLG